MRKSTAVAIALTLTCAAEPGLAQDFDAYSALVERANAAHQLLEGAPEDRQDALRETALDADMAVIDWLDDFLATDAYSGLPEDQQMLVVRNRYRWEYNVAALLIPLDRCEEASQRVRALLDRPMNDPELRPRLTEAYENAITCVNRPRYATLRVDSTPSGADVFVDGVLAGLSGADISVSLGEHEVIVRTAGFIEERRSILASEEGQVIALGPITLVESEPVEPDYRPTWYEWTLWGAGAAGIAASVVYYLQANDRQDGIDNPPTGFAVADETREQGIVDDLRLVSYLTGGAGIICAVAGTISYVSRDKLPDAGPAAGEARLGIGLGGVTLQVGF